MIKIAFLTLLLLDKTMGSCATETTPYFFGSSGKNCQATSLLYLEQENRNFVSGICADNSSSLGFFMAFDSTSSSYEDTISVPDLQTFLSCRTTDAKGNHIEVYCLSFHSSKLAYFHIEPRSKTSLKTSKVK